MDANFEKYGTFFYEVRAGIQTLSCVISHTHNRTVVIVMFPQIIEVVSTKYAFFLSSFFPRKDLLSVRNVLVSVRFPSETSFFLSKILTHENFRSFYFFKLICLLPQTWLVDIM